MIYNSLKELYDAIADKMSDYKIALNDNSLVIENESKHSVKVVYNRGLFDVYIDNIYYYGIDGWDIEGIIESIVFEEYIVFDGNTVDILPLNETIKLLKKDPDIHVIKF